MLHKITEMFVASLIIQIVVIVLISLSQYSMCSPVCLQAYAFIYFKDA
jgi:hypothetical protein